MIKTKRQYQWVEQWSCDHDMRLSDEEKQDVYETFEALRDVARAAHKWEMAEHDEDVLRYGTLIISRLDALPDWLTDG